MIKTEKRANDKYDLTFEGDSLSYVIRDLSPEQLNVLGSEIYKVVNADFFRKAKGIK